MAPWTCGLDCTLESQFSSWNERSGLTKSMKHFSFCSCSSSAGLLLFSAFYIFFALPALRQFSGQYLFFFVCCLFASLKKVVVIFFARFVPVNNVIAQHGVVHDGVQEERRGFITSTENGSTSESGACKCIGVFKWFL